MIGRFGIRRAYASDGSRKKVIKYQVSHTLFVGEQGAKVGRKVSAKPAMLHRGTEYLKGVGERISPVSSGESQLPRK